MSRLLSATLLLLLLSLPMSAQTRGGGHSFGGARSFSGGMRTFSRPSGSFHSRGAFGFSGPRSGFVHQPNFIHRPGHFPGRPFRTFGRVHRPYFYFGYYGAYGYPYYSFYPYYSYDSYYSGSVYDASIDRSYQQYQQLSNDVNDLSSEVRDLRDRNAQLQYDLDRQAVERQTPAPAPPSRAIPNSVTEAPKTVLVFRDGRHLEVSNYAIAGQTLWILSEQNAKKVPLSDLDLSQSKSENAQRGIDFTYPGSR